MLRFKLFLALSIALATSDAYTSPLILSSKRAFTSQHPSLSSPYTTRLYGSDQPSESSVETSPKEQVAMEKDFEEPEDPVVNIKPPAMNRLRELKEKQSKDETLVLRMGVRNGGCSGLSYVMDFSTEDAIEEEDAVDEYEKEGIKCVVDAKSLLYLYGLELDYSDELIGGGFKFFNPNAEESCGCGSSFGV